METGEGNRWEAREGRLCPVLGAATRHGQSLPLPTPVVRVCEVGGRGAGAPDRRACS